MNTRLRERCPLQLDRRCPVCDELMWLVPGQVGGWYVCCHNFSVDHGSYGRNHFQGWSDACLPFLRLAEGGYPA